MLSIGSKICSHAQSFAHISAGFLQMPRQALVSNCAGLNSCSVGNDMYKALDYMTNVTVFVCLIFLSSWFHAGYVQHLPCLSLLQLTTKNGI